MRIGWVGLGKLGGPIAGELARQGHEVYGFDTAAAARPSRLQFPSLVRNAGTLEYLVRQKPELVFVAVPTPHEARFEGVAPLPDDRADFDYTALRAVLVDLRSALADSQTLTVVVVSTCLPGTYRETLAPWATGPIRYVHSPSFIGMGTVVEDFLVPEFWLIGTPDRKAPAALVALYRSICDKAPIITTDVTTAEAIKVAYNTSISAKIAVANTWGELAGCLGIDADEIAHALGLAERRLTSSAYMRAGMGDGGPCHPRDLIACSWLAQKHGLSYDLFDSLALQRERHTQQLASAIAALDPPDVVLWGRGFKANTAIETGSPALLLAHYLAELGVIVEHQEDTEPGACNVIAAPHDRYRDIRWPVGSTVVDPFGMIDEQEGVTVIRPGRR